MFGKSCCCAKLRNFELSVPFSWTRTTEFFVIGKMSGILVGFVILVGTKRLQFTLIRTNFDWICWLIRHGWNNPHTKMSTSMEFNQSKHAPLKKIKLRTKFQKGLSE